jgi:hypothetical protein
VLKPGGLLFIYHFPNRWSYSEALAGIIDQDRHERRFSRQQMRRALAQHGFEVEWFEYRYMLPRNLVEFPRLRGLIDGRLELIYRVDRSLARIPILNTVSNALNLLAIRS